jgi:nitrite reductase/ring-hydroxylating ferredoxin subunit
LLAVATGKGRRGLDEALAHSQLHAMFDATRTADETAGKPHPLMLQELMAELGATPERTLMIGDTTHDLQLARNAGTARVAVELRRARHPGLRRARAAVRRAQHAELHDWLLAGTHEARQRPARPGPVCVGRAGRSAAVPGCGTCWSMAVRRVPSRCASTAVLRAYLNRCAHVPAEMDWQPGEFLDSDRRWIVCSIHGASYDRPTAAAWAAPAAAAGSSAMAVGEADGQVYWYPSRDIQPVASDAPAAESPR